MARLRTFIAVDLGKPIRDRVVALQENLARSAEEVKWVEPENLHVTLLFLGEVDARAVPAVCRAVADTCKTIPSFEVQVASAGCFPSPRRPRILWVGIGTGAAELVQLHDVLEVPLLELGCYRREARRFTPHITIGRVKSDRSTDRLTAALAKHAQWQGGATHVSTIQIMSSELTPRGPVYTVMSRAKLC